MMGDNIQELRVRIKIARGWAHKYFRHDAASNTQLLDNNDCFLPPSAFVEFPSPDTMEVRPAAIGKPIGITYKYRLAFYSNGNMAWCGRHPFYQTPLAPLLIREDYKELI